MDGSFHNSWQERWSGLANRLEAALENNAYRFFLCFATVMMVIAYAAVASRIADQPRFVASSVVQIDDSLIETSSGPMTLTALDVDLLNRSIQRLEKLANVLGIRPKRLTLKPSVELIRTRLAIEYHVLRLWMDEARGFFSGGVYDMTSEAIANTILAVTFRDEQIRTALPAASSSWYEQVQTLKDTCRERKHSHSARFSSWMGLCARDRIYGGDGPTPLSLAPWLTRLLISEAEARPVVARIDFLRSLVRASSDTRVIEFERANRWPANPKLYGEVLREIVTMTGVVPTKSINFRPNLPFLQVALDGKTKDESRVNGVHVGLLVVTSCQTPRLADFQGFDAHEVVWAQVCAKSLSSIVSLARAENAEQFAEKNPDVSFVQLGVKEIAYALSQGWIDARTDVGDFVTGSRNLNSRMVAYQVKPQSEEWLPKAQAFRVKAPIEVLKLVRLNSI